MASTSDLSPAERQRFIMNWLAEKPNISVSDIVRRFSVSEVTARHDLISLESEGKLRRVRGGAVSLSRSNAISYPEERINVQVEAKEAIAATAATLVDDGDVLVIDIGTTGFYFAKALMDKREITIITGDLAIANYASFNLPNASVVLLGGSVRGRTNARLHEQTTCRQGVCQCRRIPPRPRFYRRARLLGHDQAYVPYQLKPGLHDG